MNKETLYCIHCGDVYPIENTPLGKGHAVFVVTDDYPFFDHDFCEMPCGSTYCPPPPFDMDEFMVDIVEDEEFEVGEYFEPKKISEG